jgi:CubicO group peptidase (beta-lactamase class C family)
VGRDGEGYGWIVLPTPRNTIALQHAGGNNFGFDAVMMSYPQEDVVVVVMTNQPWKDRRDALERALRAVFAAE